MAAENTNEQTGTDENIEELKTNDSATDTESVESADDELEEDDDLFYLPEDDDDSEEEDNDDTDQEESEDALPEESEANEKSADADETEAVEEKEVLTAPTANDSDFYDKVTEAAKERVKAVTGKDYDEFNPKHNVILTIETGKIVKHFESEQTALAKSNEIIKTMGGEKFQAFMRNELENRPHKFVKELKAAEESGDYSKTLAFMQEAASKFKGDKVKEEAKAKIEKLNDGKPAFKPVAKKPPVTISPATGHGVRGGKRIDSDDMLSPFDLGLELDD